MGTSRESIEHFRRVLLEWSAAHGRRFPWRNRSASKYVKIVAEMLLQRTRAETVARFLPEFISHYPSWSQLANAKEEELRDFIRPIGLWRSRAPALIRLATELSRRNGRFPKKRGEIEQLPGVGQYIANSVMLLCHHEPYPLLDANMARVLERNFGCRKLRDIRYDPYLQELARAVVDCTETLALNWAILDFAARVCKTRSPKCSECPLASTCKFFQVRAVP